MVAVPLAGVLTPTRVSASPLASVSLASTSIVALSPTFTGSVRVSSLATGASFTTVSLRVAVDSYWPSVTT